MDSEELLDAIYFTGPFGTTGSILHSAVPPVALLLVYWLLKLGRRDRRRILLGWFGHTLADFLTHGDDVRPLFWPITDWTWSSPISYYNSAYHGRAFFGEPRAHLPDHGALLVRRLRRRQREADPIGKSF